MDVCVMMIFNQWSLEPYTQKWYPIGTIGTIATNGTLISKRHSFFLSNHVYIKRSNPSGQGHLS